MATYVNNLRLKEITTGDEDGTWGTSTNTNLELITDGFSYGTKQMSSDANQTFTMPDATADATRGFYLRITSAGSLTGTREVTLGPNTVSKTWIIENATTGSQIITIKQGSGATVNVANGSKVMIVTDGLGSGAAVFNANPTGAVVDLTSDVTGTLPVANGGTGITSLGSGVATWLGTPSSANLATAVTDETGSGALVFATSPTLVTPVLGTPASGNLSNCTADGTNDVGTNNVAAVGTKTSAYTLAVGDVGKYVQVGSSGSIVVPNATFAEGDAVSIFNNTSGNITITCSITTAYIAGTDSDKSTMTLATRGVATVLFISGYNMCCLRVSILIGNKLCQA